MIWPPPSALVVATSSCEQFEWPRARAHLEPARNHDNQANGAASAARPRRSRRRVGHLSAAGDHIMPVARYDDDDDGSGNASGRRRRCSSAVRRFPSPRVLLRVLPGAQQLAASNEERRTVRQISRRRLTRSGGDGDNRTKQNNRKDNKQVARSMGAANGPSRSLARSPALSASQPAAAR